jgi:hypothetical protein
MTDSVIGEGTSRREMDMSTSTAPRAARPVQQEWDRLGADGPLPDAFDPVMLVGLPEPARRWLTHAITPGTPLWGSVEVVMSGEIRLGAWRRFTAAQVVAPPDGYIWAATASLFGLPVTGYDRLSSGTAQMRWRLLGVVPVMTADGPDVVRSAAGRLAIEFLLVPTAFRAARWRLGGRPDTAVAAWRIGTEEIDLEVHIGPDGRLLGALLERWGNPGGAPYGHYPFGAAVEAEQTFAGITIPSTLRVGWWWGTDRQDEGEFFHARITDATFHS